MQLNLGADGGEDDETFDTVALTILPPAAAAAGSDGSDGSDGDGDDTLARRRRPSSQPRSEAVKLFIAISACADLHPDPAEDDDDDDGYDAYEDRIVFEGAADGAGDDRDTVEGFSGVYRGLAGGGLPPPMSGSSGWITADNIHEHFDAQGNWIRDGHDDEGVSGDLGEGAGRVRGRDEVNGHGADGTDQDGLENKRPRTE